MDEYIEKMKQFDSIKAPEYAVDKAVRAALDAEKNGKEYTMKPKKKTSGILKVTAAAASVVLAAGVGTGILFNGTYTGQPADTQVSQSQTVKNSFFLTVNAAELKEGETVNFVDLDTSEPGELFNTGVDAVKPDEILNSDGSDTDLILKTSLVFPVGCYGENIKSVKYEINNAFYSIYTDSKPDEEGFCGGLEYTHPGLITKGEKLSASELGLFLYNNNIPKNVIEAYKDDPYYVHNLDLHSYRSFTVNYDQTDLSAEEINDLIIQREKGNFLSWQIRLGTRTNRALLDSDDPKIREAAVYLTHMRGSTQEKEFFNERDDLRKAILEGMIKDITIDITVTFKDGETEKRTIALEPGELVTPNRDGGHHLNNLAISVKARLLGAEKTEGKGSAASNESSVKEDNSETTVDTENDEQQSTFVRDDSSHILKIASSTKEYYSSHERIKPQFTPTKRITVDLEKLRQQEYKESNENKNDIPGVDSRFDFEMYRSARVRELQEKMADDGYCDKSLLEEYTGKKIINGQMFFLTDEYIPIFCDKIIMTCNAYNDPDYDISDVDRFRLLEAIEGNYFSLCEYLEEHPDNAIDAAKEASEYASQTYAAEYGRKPFEG